MRNPYEVLGILEGASVDEIRAAYKKLVRKYHPDQYSDHPLSDLAEEKMKEINEAYDYLLKGKGGERQYNQSHNYKDRQYNSNTNIFNDVRILLNQGKIGEAERRLEAVVSNDRNAEWHFLKGVVYLRKGWYDQAYNYIKHAVDLDPGNKEYASALNNLHVRNRTYRDVGTGMGYGRREPSACEICQCLICTDCCCECMGGDFISCC